MNTSILNIKINIKNPHPRDFESEYPDWYHAFVTWHEGKKYIQVYKERSLEFDLVPFSDLALNYFGIYDD